VGGKRKIEEEIMAEEPYETLDQKEAEDDRKESDVQIMAKEPTLRRDKVEGPIIRS
jgi:hypothetical protein